MFVDDLHIDRGRLAAVCAKYGVTKLEVFGSFVRGDAQSGSVPFWKASWDGKSPPR